MKRFDQNGITERLINNLQSKAHWNNLQEDGATYQLLEAIAESEAEIARYGEYLLQELKWDTSRNFSSTKHIARLVGKKLDRKHSAVGTIIVSHSDLEGIARYSFLGVNNFAIDSESNYDNQTKDESLTADSYKYSLVPWVDTNCYTVPLNAIFSTKDGINFICAESKTIQTWASNWSSVEKSYTALQSFKAADGWNNYKYLTIPVVQGDLKEVTLGESNGSASQSFLVSSLDIEAADSYYTKQFCYIEVIDVDNNVTRWTEIQHLQIAESTDKVFEINILDDLSGTEIRFGDSINGAIPSDKSTIIFHFLETKGADGNVTDLYAFKNEISGISLPTNTKFPGLSIGCQNMWPIVGGKDLETLSEFKANAETAYAKNYEILHTFTELIDNINSISPIPLIKVKTKTYYETTTINTTTLYKNIIGITGLSTGLEPLNTLEKAIFERVINTDLNSKILSNKLIKYVAPSIIELDSAIEIELKNPIISTDSFKLSLENHLQNIYGKANLDTIDHYMQADLVKESLNYSDNIGSIQATSLFTIACSNITYGTIENNNGLDESKYFLFTFTLPDIEMDMYNRENYCNRSLVDGNEIVYVFNINITGNTTTFIVKEENTTENTVYLYDVDSFFDTDSANLIYLYNFTDTENKYTMQQLLKEKHTFSRKELSSLSNLQFSTTVNYSTYSFSVKRSNKSLTLYLLLDANTIAKNLNFNNTINDSNIKKIYNSLLTSIDNGFSKITASFEPADKTVTSDWNTIMYYNNIEAIISQ